MITIDRPSGGSGPVEDDSTDLSQNKLQRAGSLLRDSGSVVAFSGAGMSTESGIPDFRSPGGIWDQYDPSDFTLQALYENPQQYWEKRRELLNDDDFNLMDVDPNPAHHALARLEEHDRLDAVITQNIDGLHQKAGHDPHRVLELHGTAHRARCLQCDRTFDVEVLRSKLDQGDIPPRCEHCNGLMKSATVSFGEALPRDVLQESQRLVRNVECMLVLGSSLTVEPAASLPRSAHRHGASLIIVNLEPTPMDSASEVAFHGRVGTVLPRIVETALSD